MDLLPPLQISHVLPLAIAVFHSPKEGGNFPYTQTKSVLFKLIRNKEKNKLSRVAWLWSKPGNRTGVDLSATRQILNRYAPCHFMTNELKVKTCHTTQLRVLFTWRISNKLNGGERGIIISRNNDTFFPNFIRGSHIFLQAPQMANSISCPKVGTKDELILAKSGLMWKYFRTRKAAKLKSPEDFFTSRRISANGTHWTWIITSSVQWESDSFTEEKPW